MQIFCGLALSQEEELHLHTKVMASTKMLTCLSIFFSILIYFIAIKGNLSCAQGSMTFFAPQKIRCSVQKFEEGGAFGIIIKDAVNDVVHNTTSQSPPNHYYKLKYIPEISNFPYIYIEGNCTEDLVKMECDSCLTQAEEAIFTECKNSIFARYFLSHCMLRYGIYGIG